MRAIKPSSERSCVWRWLWQASHQAADTETKLSDKLSPLTEPFKSSSLWPASRGLTWRVTCSSCGVPPPADGDGEYGSEPRLCFTSRGCLMFLFPVIKLSLPCCCVKRHLNCQLGLGDVSLGPFLSYLLLQWCGQLNFSWLQSVWSSLLDRRFWQSLWFCCPSKCRSASAQLSAFIQAE